MCLKVFWLSGTSWKKLCQCNTVSKSFQKNKEELNWSLLEILYLRQCWLKVQISFHWKSCVGHSTAWHIFFSKPYRPSDLWQNLKHRRHNETTCLWLYQIYTCLDKHVHVYEKSCINTDVFLSKTINADTDLVSVSQPWKALAACANWQ